MRERKRSVTDSPAVLMGQGGDVEAYLSYQTTHAAGKSTCASSYDSVFVRTGGWRSLPKMKNREDMCNCCFDICRDISPELSFYTLDLELKSM